MDCGSASVEAINTSSDRVKEIPNQAYPTTQPLIHLRQVPGQLPALPNHQPPVRRRRHQPHVVVIVAVLVGPVAVAVDVTR